MCVPTTSTHRLYHIPAPPVPHAPTTTVANALFSQQHFCYYSFYFFVFCFLLFPSASSLICPIIFIIGAHFTLTHTQRFNSRALRKSFEKHIPQIKFTHSTSLSITLRTVLGFQLIQSNQQVCTSIKTSTWFDVIALVSFWCSRNVRLSFTFQYVLIYCYCSNSKNEIRSINQLNVNCCAQLFSFISSLSSPLFCGI